MTEKVNGAQDMFKRLILSIGEGTLKCIQEIWVQVPATLQHEYF